MKVRLWPVRREGRDTYEVELMSKGTDTGNTPDLSPTHEPMTAAEKRQAAAYCDDILALYTYAYKQAKQLLEPMGATEPTIHAAASGAAISTQRRFGLAGRVEFKGGADAAVNCASPEKPGARLDDAQKPQSSVAKPTAQTGAQARPVQPNLVNVPSRTPVSTSSTGSHWDIAG